MEYYRYDEWEAVLDTFAFGGEARPAEYIMHYLTLKWAIAGVACVHYSGGGYVPEQCMAYAWEDVEIAFVGHRQFPLTPLVEQLWLDLGPARYNQFETVVDIARECARNKTDESVQRRYMRVFRDKPVRRPEQGFNLPSVNPSFGPGSANDLQGKGLVPSNIERWLRMAENDVFKTSRTFGTKQ